MATQLGAVTGRRIPSQYRSIINAEASRLPDMYAMREDRKYRENLSAQRERELQLAEESQRIQERQAKIATGISAAQVGATGYLARSMTAGGGTATPATTVPIGSSSDFYGAPGTPVPQATTMGYLGTAGAGYMGGKIGGRLGEKYIPEGLVKGKESRGRWGSMAGGAAAGAAYGTWLAPGVGTGIGAVIGGVAGLVSSYF